MSILSRILIVNTILFSQCLYATSVDDYVKVYTANQGNRIGSELCECMGNKGKVLREEEFEFFTPLLQRIKKKLI